jgi:hypothetical protein
MTDRSLRWISATIRRLSSVRPANSLRPNVPAKPPSQAANVQRRGDDIPCSVPWRYSLTSRCHLPPLSATTASRASPPKASSIRSRQVKTGSSPSRGSIPLMQRTHMNKEFKPRRKEKRNGEQIRIQHAGADRNMAKAKTRNPLGSLRLGLENSKRQPDQPGRFLAGRSRGSRCPNAAEGHPARR